LSLNCLNQLDINQEFLKEKIILNNEKQNGWILFPASNLLTERLLGHLTMLFQLQKLDTTEQK